MSSAWHCMARIAGPGAYQAADSQKKQYAAVDPNISVFRGLFKDTHCPRRWHLHT